MPARDLSIRPLGLGEVIDRSIALGIRHFRPLFLAMLVIQAPAVALARVQSGSAAELLALATDPTRAAEVLPRLAATFAAMLVVLLALQLAATGAAAAIVEPSLAPRPAGGRPGSARRAAAVASACALQVLVLVAAPLLGAAPGLLLARRAASTATAVAGLAGAAAGAALLSVVVLLRLMLAPVAAAVEARGGLAALVRSSRLMAPPAGGRWRDRPGLRASLVLLATLLLAVAVNGIAGLPRVIAARAVAAPGALALLGGGLPPALEVALSVFEAVAAAALQPFSLVAVAVLYFDRRARAEALDVELWADALEAGR